MTARHEFSRPPSRVSILPVGVGGSRQAGHRSDPPGGGAMSTASPRPGGQPYTHYAGVVSLADRRARRAWRLPRPLPGGGGDAA